jgi:hypothetical protein
MPARALSRYPHLWESLQGCLSCGLRRGLDKTVLNDLLQHGSIEW